MKRTLLLAALISLPFSAHALIPKVSVEKDVYIYSDKIVVETKDDIKYKIETDCEFNYTSTDNIQLYSKTNIRQGSKLYIKEGRKVTACRVEQLTQYNG